ALGNQQLMDDLNVYIEPTIAKEIELLQSTGSSVSFLSIDNQYAGYIAIKDKIKSNAKDIIQQLQQENIKVWMLTGDNALTAKAVAEEIHIDNYKAKLLPENKLQIVKTLQDEGNIVAMAGDGINDRSEEHTSELQSRENLVCRLLL